jgi:Nitrile hydratase beta subunit, N-terminal
MDLDTDGPAAPPRLNGELVFESPWESRIFGLTAALVEDGRLDWPAFQAALIEAVAEDEQRPYWESWLAATTRLTGAAGLLGTGELDGRAAELAARPAGHDHRH